MRVHVMRSAVLEAPIAAVWQRLRDFNGHAHWHPAVADSAIENDEPSDRVGVVRAFTLKSGGFFREQLIELSDRDHHLTYCLLDAPLRLDGYVATMHLRPVTDRAQTLLVWEGRFAPPADQADALARLVATSIYEDGLASLKRLFADDAAPAAPIPAPRAEAVRRVAPPAAAGATIAAQAILVERYGGPEVLAARTIDVAPPGPGEVRIAQEAIGVNFIDLHCRAGELGLMPLPGIPGMEAAGTILDTGPGVGDLVAGDRVVYACEPVGAYVGIRTMAAHLVMRLPQDIAADTAAALTLKGLMADVLVSDVHRPSPGETALVRTAAGGVGLLLVGMLKARGVTLIGVVSNEDKAVATRRAGCHHVVIGNAEAIAATVARVTEGRGVDAIFDGLGRDTFDPSLDLLAPRGHLISYGQATGPIGSRDIDRLAAKSVRISRPNLGHFIGRPDERNARAVRLFGLLRGGTLMPEPVRRLPLAEAAEAHRILASRRNIGALVLVPER